MALESVLTSRQDPEVLSKDLLDQASPANPVQSAPQKREVKFDRKGLETANSEERSGCNYCSNTDFARVNSSDFAKIFDSADRSLGRSTTTKDHECAENPLVAKAGSKVTPQTALASLRQAPT